MAAAKETCPLHCKDQIALRLSCMSAGGSWTKASMHSGGSVVISVVKTALSKPRALNAEQALPYTSVGPSCAFVMQIQTIVHCMRSARVYAMPVAELDSAFSKKEIDGSRVSLGSCCKAPCSNTDCLNSHQVSRPSGSNLLEQENSNDMK